MGPHVLVQSSLLAEGLVAFAALVRLLLQRQTRAHTHTQADTLLLKRALHVLVHSTTIHDTKPRLKIRVHCGAQKSDDTHT